MTTPKHLTITKHARWRMERREITENEVYRAIRTGHREPRGPCVVHYDPQSYVAVLVNWRQMKVITVYLCKRHYDRRRAAKGLTR